MREFGQDYLFKVSFLGEYKFSKPPKPVYVVSANKNDAEKFALRNIKSGCKIKAVTLLAEQWGNNYFSGEFSK